MPASVSLDARALPLGLAQGVRLLGAVRQGQVLRWSDVAIDETVPALRARRDMEELFGRAEARQRVA